MILQSRTIQNRKILQQIHRSLPVQVEKSRAMSLGLDDPQAGDNVVAQEFVQPVSVFLVAKRPPLANHPRLWRWLARFVYQRIGWAPDYGIEYQGVFFEESAARHAASESGGFFIELPLNDSLPQEAAQYGAHDFPLSEASPFYRKRTLPFAVVPRRSQDLTRAQLDALEARMDEVGSFIRGDCARAI